MGARSELNSVFGFGKVDRWNPIRTSAIQSRSRPLGFSDHEKGAQRQEISKWSTVCSTFSRSGWSVVRSASLTKGGTSKKRPSLHLHKAPTRSNNVSPWTFHMAHVECAVYTALWNSLIRSRALSHGFVQHIGTAFPQIISPPLIFRYLHICSGEPHEAVLPQTTRFSVKCIQQLENQGNSYLRC
jgi:hypothetical protein